MKALISLFVVTFALCITKMNASGELTRNLKSKLNSGDLMPMVGFGTSDVKGRELTREVLDYVLAAGYRLIDTAKVYNNEEDIGQALKELLPKHNLTRKDIWITTKLSPYDHGEKAYEALEESVRKLDSGYVDLYLIHWPSGNFSGNVPGVNNSVLRDKSWKNLVKGVKSGLAKNIGVSNYFVKHLNELLANDHGIRPAVNQFEWHPHYHPQELLDSCRKEDILLQAYSSLGGPRSESLRKNHQVEQIAKKLGKSPVQVLLKWALQQNIAIIPQSKSKKHIEENIALNFNIPEEDMKSLSALSDPNYDWGPDIE